jgi:hypothetical protein
LLQQGSAVLPHSDCAATVLHGELTHTALQGCKLERDVVVFRTMRRRWSMVRDMPNRAWGQMSDQLRGFGHVDAAAHIVISKSNINL